MKSSHKTALITGGAKRIGLAIANTLHAADYNIMVHYRSSSSAAAKLVDELNTKRPNSAAMVQCDLMDTNSIPGVIEATVTEFERLDVLVNNASTFYPTPIELVNIQFWQDLIGSNLKAPAFLVKYAAPYLRAHNGCIINITDIYAERPLSNHPIYCSAKAGLEMLTKSLAKDLAPEIRANGVSPGAILWPETGNPEANKEELIARIPLQCMGEPSDIANTVKFLVADAPYITGQIIAVDGGRSIMI